MSSDSITFEVQIRTTKSLSVQIQQVRTLDLLVQLVRTLTANIKQTLSAEMEL